LTKAQCDLAYNLVSELSVYADAIEKYGNQNISASMRNAASLLSQMVEENEKPVGIASGEPVVKRQENSDVFPGFRGNNDYA